MFSEQCLSSDLSGVVINRTVSSSNGGIKAWAREQEVGIGIWLETEEIGDDTIRPSPPAYSLLIPSLNTSPRASSGGLSISQVGLDSCTIGLALMAQTDPVPLVK